MSIEKEHNCICGGKMILGVGDVNFNILGHNITVQKVPHYQCEKCKRITYDSNTEIDKFLKYAYENKLYINRYITKEFNSNEL
jgi:YgiT-type zinc finger domain-containing protein